MERKKRRLTAEKPSYQPTEQERATIRANYARRVASTTPRLKVLKESEPIKISADHPDPKVGYLLLMEALGTADIDFTHGLLRQLVNAGSAGDEIDEDGINFMLAVVKGIKPNDQIETMLAVQMAAIHMATLTFARRLARVETIQQQDSAERALNKLARTYTTQIEALKRYRTGGEQKVTVQHVSVGEGGQAIVGNVTQSTRETTAEKPVNLAVALTNAPETAFRADGKRELAPVPIQRRRKNDRSSTT